MTTLFYISAAVALLATARVITSRAPVHALLHLVVSLLAVAAIFFALGATFAAALEVILYAGAIMVLFVFAIMLLNIAPGGAAERRLFRPTMLIGPALLAAALLAALARLIVSAGGQAGQSVAPAEVGRTLFGPYVIAVELASLLLLAALVAAYHLTRDGGTGFHPVQKHQGQVENLSHQDKPEAPA